MKRHILFPILILGLALFVVGCGHDQTNTNQNQNLNQNTNTAEEANQNTNSSVEVDASNWVVYESKDVGIKFKFPKLDGNVNYSFVDCRDKECDPYGTVLSWKITEPEGYSYSFAGSASQDMSAGRDRDVTENYFLQKTNDKYKVLTQIVEEEQISYEVHPLETMTTEYNTLAVIFDRDRDIKQFELYELTTEDILEKIAIMNFPENYHNKLKSVTFYFKQETSNETIKEVINSVEFTN